MGFGLICEDLWDCVGVGVDLKGVWVNLWRSWRLCGCGCRFERGLGRFVKILRLCGCGFEGSWVLVGDDKWLGRGLNHLWLGLLIMVTTMTTSIDRRVGVRFLDNVFGFYWLEIEKFLDFFYLDLSGLLCVWFETKSWLLRKYWQEEKRKTNKKKNKMIGWD